MVILGGISIALSIICYPFISPALRKVCLPYVPATNLQIQNVLHVIKGRKGKLIDLGSGDGRIVCNIKYYLCIYNFVYIFLTVYVLTF